VSDPGSDGRVRTSRRWNPRRGGQRQAGAGLEPGGKERAVLQKGETRGPGFGGRNRWCPSTVAPSMAPSATSQRPGPSTLPTRKRAARSKTNRCSLQRNARCTSSNLRRSAATCRPGGWDAGGSREQSTDGRHSVADSHNPPPGQLDLERFEVAQRDTHPTALSELRRGAQRSHRMWFIFPQFRGLGSSPRSERFAIRCVSETGASTACWGASEGLMSGIPLTSPRVLQLAMTL
jgi:hypothetical protein